MRYTILNSQSKEFLRQIYYDSFMFDVPGMEAEAQTYIGRIQLDNQPCSSLYIQYIVANGIRTRQLQCPSQHEHTVMSKIGQGCARELSLSLMASKHAPYTTRMFICPPLCPPSSGFYDFTYDYEAGLVAIAEAAMCDRGRRRLYSQLHNTYIVHTYSKRGRRICEAEFATTYIQQRRTKVLLMQYVGTQLLCKITSSHKS